MSKKTGRVKAIQAADVILAVRPRTETKVLLFGREYLPRLTETQGGRSILNPDLDPNVRVMQIEVASDYEFQRLCDDVLEAKGSIDEGFSKGGPPIPKSTERSPVPVSTTHDNSELQRLAKTSRSMEDFSPEELTRLIMDVDLLWAFDRDDLNNSTLFFGEKTLQRIMNSEIELDAKMAGLRIDWHSEQPEYLAAAVEAIKGKGSCDYLRRS